MTDTVKKPNILKKILLIALAVDVVWAAIIATFSSTIISQVGSGAGADQTATTLATVLGWLIAFVGGFIQGAIFMVVIGGFIFVGLFLYAMLTKKSS